MKAKTSKFDKEFDEGRDVAGGQPVIGHRNSELECLPAVAQVGETGAVQRSMRARASQVL